MKSKYYRMVKERKIPNGYSCRIGKREDTAFRLCSLLYDISKLVPIKLNGTWVTISLSTINRVP